MTKLSLRARIAVTLLATAVLASPAAALSLGEGGFSPADMDRSVSACQDFYQYAVGGWLRANPIPADYPSWGAFNELNERNREALHQILERLAKSDAPASSDEGKLGDFYASCMDEAAIEAQGARPLADELLRIAAIRMLPELTAEIARLQTYALASMTPASSATRKPFPARPGTPWSGRRAARSGRRPKDSQVPDVQCLDLLL